MDAAIEPPRCSRVASLPKSDVKYFFPALKEFETWLGGKDHRFL